MKTAISAKIQEQQANNEQTQFNLNCFNVDLRLAEISTQETLLDDIFKRYAHHENEAVRHLGIHIEKLSSNPHLSESAGLEMLNSHYKRFIHNLVLHNTHDEVHKKAFEYIAEMSYDYSSSALGPCTKHDLVDRLLSNDNISPKLAGKIIVDYGYGDFFFFIQHPKTTPEDVTAKLLRILKSLDMKAPAHVGSNAFNILSHVILYDKLDESKWGRISKYFDWGSQMVLQRQHKRVKAKEIICPHIY